jgi:hypothetical protein
LQTYLVASLLRHGAQRNPTLLNPFHDDVGKALQAFLNAKTKKGNHFAMSNLQTYPELTT